MGKLIFVDTNIFLDFYRAENGNSLSLLKKLETIKNKLIITSQVEMEFQKKRQKVLIDSIKAIPNYPRPQLCSFLNQDEDIKAFRENLDKINDDLKKIKDRLINALKQPDSDPVYEIIRKLWDHKSRLNLTKENALRPQIIEKAKNRFFLGYPPRKDRDNTIGDAFNWEWILYCAKTYGIKNITVVTRDTDYGFIYKNQPLINDWLNQECKNTNCKIEYKNKLSSALKEFSLNITKEEENNENEFVENSENRSKFSMLQTDMFKQAFFNMELQNGIDKMKLLLGIYEFIEEQKGITISDDEKKQIFSSFFLEKE